MTPTRAATRRTAKALVKLGPATSRGLRAAVVSAGALLAIVPATTGATLTNGMLLRYNTDRHDNGLPLVGVVNQAMQYGCASHDGYMALNHVIQHGEVPGKPGYTPAGNYQDGAQGGEVLAEDQPWSASYEPWRTAPLHLFELFDPTVFQVGYADLDGYQCMRVRGNDMPTPVVITTGPDGTTTTSGAPPTPAEFYAWTSDTGRVGVPQAERASESPYTPQQMVGIPAAQATGPNILLFSAGDLGTPESATLAGPSGPVATVLVNHNTHNQAGQGQWFYGGGDLIPRAPLRPLSTYTATIAWQDQGGTYTQRFTFETGPRVVFSTVSVRFKLGAGRRLRAIVTGTPAPLLALTGPKLQTIYPRLRNGRSGLLPLGHSGIWQVCANSASATHPALPACFQLQAP